MMRMQHERGAAAVEFALIAPLLLVMILAIAEFGRAYYVQTTLSQAAREAVRIKALTNDSAAAATAARTAAAPLTLATVAVSPANCVATNATVTVTYSLTFLTGMFGTGRTLTGKGVMRCNG